MNVLERRLREELRQVTDQVQPDQVRPLRAPSRAGRLAVLRRRWWLPAVVAPVVTVVVLLITLLPGSGPAEVTATSGMPRYYLAVTGSAPSLLATVRDSAGGRVTGQVTVPLPRPVGPSFWQVSAAADDRHFAIVSYLSGPGISGYAARLFLLVVSPDGHPGAPHRLDLRASIGGLPEIAMSPDGGRLALSSMTGFDGASVSAGLAVIDLGTGATRTWTGRNAGSWPGTPSWGNNGRTLTLPWFQFGTSGTDRLVGLRVLDLAARGNSLLAAPLRRFPAPALVSQAVVTGGGQTIIASSVSISGSNTMTARITELSAADGRLIRVLHTVSTAIAPVSNSPSPSPSPLPSVSPSSSPVAGMALVGPVGLLSADPSGRHVLVEDFAFGRIDDGKFTALPGMPADSAAGFGAAW